MRVVFRPEAREEAVQARDWYERQSTGLGAELVRSLEAAIAMAERRPESFPMIGGEFRRLLLRRFPYSIFYHVEGDARVVLACFHHRRDPGGLGDRLNR